MTTVVGRFAPSPSGPLHFGSLVAALGSWLSARAQGGKWLLRMEDIDPPREPAGAADTILRQLDAFGLHWDGEVMYQSRRAHRYDEILRVLSARHLTFHCACPRRTVQDHQGRCAQQCETKAFHQQQAVAIRLHAPGRSLAFDDAVHGFFACDAAEDVVLKRRDGLYAYTLAVVVDDMDQGITEIVRGADLLSATPLQIELMKQLGHRPPIYAHLPLVVQADGRKLSKQNLAPAVDASQRVALLKAALGVLGQDIPDADQPDALLETAIRRWQLGRVGTKPVCLE